MPSRVERLTIRWLLRAALLGTIVIAIWGTLSSRYYQSQLSPAADAVIEVHGTGPTAAHDADTAEGSVSSQERGNALVIVSLKSEKVDWLKGVLGGWERNVYIVDGQALKQSSKLKIPKNKGREGMAYLSFIIDNYDNLPNVTLFIHNARYQWHNDDPLYDAIPILQNFRIFHVQEQGYTNLRCGWTLGCPSEIQPGRQISTDRTETYYTDAFNILFPGEQVPEIVGVGCCAQFATTKAQIRVRPLSDYVRFRDWLLDTPLEDSISGRIMEYSWHIIFGKEPVHCPPAAECYCDTFGLCNLTCTIDACEGRYTLPPYSNMPKNWPHKGWKGEDTGIP